MLTVLHRLGVDDMQTFGDSTSEFDLNATAAMRRSLNEVGGAKVG